MLFTLKMDTMISFSITLSVTIVSVTTHPLCFSITPASVEKVLREKDSKSRSKENKYDVAIIKLSSI